MRIIENLKMLFINAGILAFLTIANIQFIMSMLVMAVTLGYTIWKWITERKEKRDKK